MPKRIIAALCAVAVIAAVFIFAAISGSTSKASAAVPNPVTGLTVTPRYTQMDVTWNAEVGAGQYWVRAFIGSRQVEWITMCGDNSNFVTFHNLDEGTTYQVTVWAGPDGPGNHAATFGTTKGTKPATSGMPTVSTTTPCPTPTPTPTPTQTTPTPTPTPTTPTPTPTGTTTCTSDFEANPSACGYPDASNTGPTGTLTNLVKGTSASGSGWSWDGSGLTISGTGATFAGFNVPGCADITGSGVTVDNDHFTCGSFSGDGIIVGGANDTISHTIVQGVNQTGSGLDAGIKDAGGSGAVANTTLNWDEIFWARSCVQDITGTMENSYCHDERDASGDHINGETQNGSGDPLLIQHNTILTPFGQTDAVGLFCDFGTESNVTVNDNILAGGGYTVYGGTGGNMSNCPVSNIKITNNRLSPVYFPSFGQYGWIAYDSGDSISGNVNDNTNAALGG